MIPHARISKDAGRNLAVFITLALVLCGPTLASEHRDRGYMYLSPVPGASHVAAQTRYVLVRFENVSPYDITNLSAFIDVTGETSGIHAGQTSIATDNRTVIFEMSSGFTGSELVTVTLDPTAGPGAGGTVDPYQFQFMIAGAMAGEDPGTITARGENPPDETRDKAFDNQTITKWRDLIVPNGTANFSWIQYVYPDSDTHVVNGYAITSANDAPERDPKDWRFYGVDGSDNLTLLDTQTGQTFAGRLQEKTFTFTNVIAYRGYHLEITSVNNPAIADSVQLAEIELIKATGSILREYWMDIEGTAVSNLTQDSRYPDNPTGSDERSSFEVPVNWANYYGTRMRGYITAPNTGSFVFWIATDDNGELWLSTDENPANADRIAYVDSWATSREWNKYTSQKSAPIQLTAGQKYYVEALMKEHGGGDNLAVGWAKPGQGTYVPSEVIPGSVLSPWTGGSAALSAGVAPAATKNQASASQKASRISAASAIQSNGVSVPSDFPEAVITVNNNPAPGYIFLENKGQSGSKYTMILDNNGDPVWYRRGGGREFKVQKNGMITWSAFRGMDKNFNFVRNYYAANAHATDDHELEVLEDGSYLIIGYHNQSGIDMSRYISGGNPYATVHATALQEFTAAGELIFQFRAWDHFDIADVEPVVENPLGGNVRFSHMNAIDVDEDGHLLISSRHISEVTKIDRNTGEIIWRLSGVHSDFTFVNDPLNGFYNQHDISALGNGRYLLFDNGNGHNPRVSRAVEYELDLQAMTATLVWEFRDTPDKYTHYMGNAQRLPNGNTLINFVLSGYPKVIEVDSNGVKQFEMYLNPGSDLYRAFRFPWDGVVDVPNLIIEPQPDNVTLLFNKFGDPDVDYYRIYGGTAPNPTTVMATSSSTLKRLVDFENGRRYYFRVTAVDIDGTESDYSDEENVVVNIILPGETVVLNGDFSQGQDSWIWQVGGSASAAWIIEDGVSHFDIDEPGGQPSDIRLMQGGIKLVNGEEYILEFDAWCDQPRYISVMVGQDESPWTDYSQMTPPYITPVRTHFRHSFVMQEASDYYARIVFDLGAYGRDIYLDNVSLREPLPDPGEGEAVTIAIVSDSQVPGVDPGGSHEDDELVEWLESLGFFVYTTCMNGSCRDENNPFVTAATLVALENADLVLVTRRTNSGNYSGNTSSWNGLHKPLVLCNGYLTQDTRWNWAPCGSAAATDSSSTVMTIESGAEDHPFLNGLGDAVELFDWSTSPTGDCPTDVYLPTCDFVSGGTLIGRYGDTSQMPVLADIPAGTSFANGNIAGDRRVFLGHWSYLSDLEAPLNRQANWDDFITEDYKRILLNIIKEVLDLAPGDFDFDGCVEFDDLVVLADEWLDDYGEFAVDLDGNGRVDFKDFAIFAENFMKSCP